MSKGLAEHIEEVLRWSSPPDSALRLPGIDCALGTTVGLERSENQDRVLVASAAFNSANSEPFLLAAVADGMGGMIEGADCARLCLSSLLSSLIKARSAEVATSLRTAIAAANESIFQKYGGRGGTTVSALLVSKSGGIAIGNVGDSRAYRFAPGDIEAVELLTEDDTIEAQMAKVRNKKPGKGGIKNQLVQFVGVGSDLSAHVSQLKSHASTKTAFLLTSDGAHDMPAEIFAAVLATASDSGETVSRLIALSQWTGGHDNASAACIFPDAVSAFLSASRERSSLATIWLPHTAVQVTRPMAETEVVDQAPQPKPTKAIQPTNRSTKAKAGSKKGRPAPKRKASTRKKAADPCIDKEQEGTQVAIEFVDESKPK